MNSAGTNKPPPGMVDIYFEALMAFPVMEICGSGFSTGNPLPAEAPSDFGYSMSTQWN